MEKYIDREEWFDSWFGSPYYDMLYAGRDDAEAEVFLQRLISWLKPKSESLMLDVACGKGRYSKVLAEMGFNVVGIDIAEPSILEAKKMETRNLHFFTHDMRKPFLQNHFDYAFNFFTSFGYFNTLNEHHDALQAIAQSLKENGVLIIDYLNVQYAEAHLVANDSKKSGEVDFEISRWQDNTHFYKTIDVQDAKNNFHHAYTEKVRKFSCVDFIEMLSWQKMQVQTIFGDYFLNTYDPCNSPRLIVVAKKL